MGLIITIQEAVQMLELAIKYSLPKSRISYEILSYLHIHHCKEHEYQARYYRYKHKQNMVKLCVFNSRREEKYAASFEFNIHR